MFERVKKYYDLGLYSKEQVGQFVLKGKLTAEEYQKITGQKWKGAK